MEGSLSSHFVKLLPELEPQIDSFVICQVTQLNSLIHMLLGDLTPGDRQKIMTICTIDVHARDVVASLISQKVRGEAGSRVLCNCHLAL